MRHRIIKLETRSNIFCVKSSIFFFLSVIERIFGHISKCQMHVLVTIWDGLLKPCDFFLLSE